MFPIRWLRYGDSLHEITWSLTKLEQFNTIKLRKTKTFNMTEKVFSGNRVSSKELHRPCWGYWFFWYKFSWNSSEFHHDSPGISETFFAMASSENWDSFGIPPTLTLPSTGIFINILLNKGFRVSFYKIQIAK